MGDITTISISEMGPLKLWEITELEVAERRSVRIQNVEFDLILQMRKRRSREVKQLGWGHQPASSELGLEFRSASWKKALCTGPLQEGRSQLAGSSSVFLFCFESKLSSVWMNKHLLDPYCVSRTFIFNQKPGWYQCDKAWFWEFCIKQQEKLNTFCCVFVPKWWWYLYFLAIKLFSKETKYLLKSQWMSFSTLKSFQNPSYMLTSSILNSRTFISLHHFPMETFGSFQLPKGWFRGL